MNPIQTANVLSTVERAIAALRQAGPVALTGEDDRAVVMLAAETVTPDALAGLDGWGGGPARLALTAERAAVLHIAPTGARVIELALDEHLRAPGVIRSLADPTADLDHPLRGPFHRLKEPAGALIEAAIKLCKIGHLLPAAVCAPLDAPAATAQAGARAAPTLEARAVMAYDNAVALALDQVAAARVPLEGAEDARVIAFRPRDGGYEHLAIVIGAPDPAQPVLTRIHSECFTGDLLGSLKCDCGQQLRGAIAEINKAGGGVLLYLAQEGRGIGLINKLRAYRLQEDGFDTVEANERLGFENDERVFLAGAEMLRALGFTAVRLMTNNPAKVEALSRFGITVTERVPHAFPANNHNEFYLATKARRSGHYLDLLDGREHDD